MTFLWNGQTLEYFDHPYRTTALNMRCVEIPIARWFIGQAPRGARILEIGNVLSHYGPVPWPAVDVLEGPIKADVMRWQPSVPVDLLISISTVEHVGFGKFAGLTPPTTPARVMARLKSFLAPGGQAVVTVPSAYNPTLDAQLKSGALTADRMWFMRARGAGNEWDECSMDETMAMSAHACSNRWSGGLIVLVRHA